MSEIYVAVKAVVMKDDKFLIIKRNSSEDVYSGEWDIPGGKVMFGEDPLGALKREVKEECGLEIEPIKPIDVWTFFKNNKQTQVIGITFLSKLISGNIKLGDEHTNYKWIEFSEIDSYKIHKGIKNIIRKLKNFSV